MKINANIYSNSNNTPNISFSKLKEIKYIKDFNPETNKDDKKALEAFNVSTAIKQLCKEFDVIAEFKKIYYADTDTTSTMMHLTAKPIMDSNFSIIARIKNHFYPKIKTLWLEGEHNHKTGKKSNLHKKIENLTVHDIDQKFNYTID